MAVTVYLGIDWDKDGNYTDESSRLKVDSLVIRRGRPNILDASGFVQMEPADVWGELRNYDNRYDPFNSGGALYGSILPGRPCKITVTSGVTTHYVFMGWITDIRSMGETRKNVVFRASDGLKFLDMQQCDEVSPATYTVAAQMALLVSQSDWPVAAGSTIEDNGDQNTLYTPDDTQTIYNQMFEAAEAWGGTIFINKEGGFEYRVRASAAATALTLTEDEIQREFETSSPWDEIYNDIRVQGRAEAATGTAVNSTSVTDYGRRTMSIGGGINDLIQTADHAGYLANWVLDYAELVKRPLKVKLTNRFTEQFSLDLLDRVQVTIAEGYGIDALYIVGYIEHRFQTRGNCMTVLYLEPYRDELIDWFYPMTFTFTLGW